MPATKSVLLLRSIPTRRGVWRRLSFQLLMVTFVQRGLEAQYGQKGENGYRWSREVTLIFLDVKYASLPSRSMILAALDEPLKNDKRM